MRVSYSLGSLLSIDELLWCARKLTKENTGTVWIPETWGMENFSMLSAASQATDARVGSSIINIYSRSPALIAMGAATVDAISKHRLTLGLGTSSIPIVEGLHGSKFERPLLRMREYVEIIRLALEGGKINYQGKIFSLRGFSLLVKPERKEIPIYLAAINKKMVELAWEIADGTIFYLRPIDEMRQTVAAMQKGRKIDVACQFITSISHDEDKAEERAKKTLAFYISVGEIYRRFLAENGFRDETDAIYDEYKKTGFSNNHDLVTDKMLDSLTICGNPERCRKQLERILDAGITHPIIQFNPIENVEESFDLFLKTFGETN